MKAFSISRKAEKKAKPVRLYFPEDKLEELYRLWDSDNAQKSVVSKYRLWNFVASIFPQTKEKPWNVSREDILRPFVIKGE
jgi:hypothetical protein